MDFKKGLQFEKTHEDFTNAIRETVDYRGDVTLHLEDGTTMDGYVFDFVDNSFHIFPPKGDKKEIPLSTVTKIDITGVDTAEGKSWEAWVAKKKQEE